MIEMDDEAKSLKEMVWRCWSQRPDNPWTYEKLTLFWEQSYAWSTIFEEAEKQKALSYVYSTIFAALTSEQRSELINQFVKDFSL